jgi:aquaporin Z
MQQILLKVARRLSINQKKFIAEVIGTFIVVVFATASVVVDAKMKGVLEIPFIAFAPLVGVAIGIIMIGDEANLGANAPNYTFPIPIIFGVEVLATALLMAIILVGVHSRGLRGFSRSF